MPVLPNVPTSEPHSSSTSKFLTENPAHALTPITEGMFGYSLTRPVHNQDYYYGIFDACQKFKCGIEGWHTESGPGVFEAVRPSFRFTFYPHWITLTRTPMQALEFGEVKQMGDKAVLFKYILKTHPEDI